MNTLKSLRETLLDTIKTVKSGETRCEQALALCALTKSVIDLTRLEMDYAQFEWGENPIDFVSNSLTEITDENTLRIEYVPDSDNGDYDKIKGDLKKAYKP